MKKKFSKILSLVLCTSIIAGTAISVSAYEVDEHDNSIESVEYQNTSDDNFENSTNVFAEISSEYKVTIPKYLVLSGTSKKASYFVKVEGDIAGYENVIVAPEDKVNLYSIGKDMQTGSVMQDKTVWQINNFDTNANGSIYANSLTAGKWTGTFNFNLDFTAQKVTDNIILPEDQWSDKEIDINAKLGESKLVKTFESVSLTSSNENVISVEGNKLNALKVGESKITVSKSVNTASNRQILNVKVVENLNNNHIHTPGSIVEENKIDFTCTKDGSCDEVIYCNTCNEELSRITKIISATGHNIKTKIETVNTSNNTDKTVYEISYCENCNEEFSRKAIIIGRVFEYGDNYYVLSSDTKTWEDANIYAKSIGGHLAMFKTLEENNYIANKVYETGIQMPYQQFFIGATDKEKEGTWKWIDGTPLAYTNFNTGEPNSGTAENYITVYVSSSYKVGVWNDCSNLTLRYLIQFDK